MSVNSPRILLVDDDKNGLRTRGTLLKSVGYSPIMVETGKEGIRVAHTEHIDCAVLDFLLTDMSGFELMKSIYRVTKVPIIVLSGMLGLPEEVKSLASDIIVKGEGALRLIDSLKRLVPISPE